MNVVVSIDNNKNLEARTIDNLSLINYVKSFKSPDCKKSVFVNGSCVFKGGLTKEQIKDWSSKLKGVS